MKKNLFKRALTLALCATTAFSIVGCGGGGGNEDSSGPADKPVDTNKTQIRVNFYNSGYGDKWPYELAAAFEEAVKDISFEDDKMGVQVHPDGDKSDLSAQQIKSGDFDVYFLETPSDYNNMMSSLAFEPLDSIVNEVSPFDGKKIVDKMTAQQQGYFSYNHETAGQHYYTLPHYAGNYSIIYNVDLFDEMGFYFAETPDADGNRLIGPGGGTKSAGPDGQKGTSDDGMPTTYEEFFYLCGEINANDIDPVCFPGKFAAMHVSLVADSLAAAYEGAEQTELNFSFSGTAKNLIKTKADGSPVLQNGQPVFDDPLEITKDNAYNLSRQAGYYYAFQFMEKLIGDTRYYNEIDGRDTDMTHQDMEAVFLESGLSTDDKRCAMLFDGTWWQMDAATTFDNMTLENPEWSKDKRNFGLMTLPQPTAEDAAKVASGEKKPVFMDYLMACCGVKAGLPAGRKKAALAFVQYAYSDQAMAEFTYSTGAPIGMKYMDAIDKSKLNPWETSVIEYMEKADVIYKVSDNPYYKANWAPFRGFEKYKLTIGTIDVAVRKDGYKAGDFFKAYQSQFKGLAWATA